MHRDWGQRDTRWEGIRSELIEVAGTQVHLLRAEGPADGRTQLLIHGLGGTAANWLEVMQGLAEHGPVVAPDLPGFGRTEPPDARGSRLASNLAFLPAFVRALGIERAVVHGNSMGGLLAVRFAAEHPDVVERLVLVDPALPTPRMKTHTMAPKTLRTFAPFLVPSLGRRLVGRLYASRTAEELYEENQALVHADPSRLREPMRAVGRENVAYAQRTPWRIDGFAGAAESVVTALVGARGVLRAVDAVQAPTLLVWGDADELVGRPAIEAVARRRPDWELLVMEDVGHVPMLEVPDDYLAAIAGWYAEQDARV